MAFSGGQGPKNSSRSMAFSAVQGPVNINSPRRPLSGVPGPKHVRRMPNGAGPDYSILKSAGVFTSTRVIQQRHPGMKISDVISLMKVMTQPDRGHQLYAGEYKELERNIKVFYKCPPELISSEALARYGFTKAEYHHNYYKDPRTIGSLHKHTDEYLALIEKYSPYRLINQ